MTHFLIVWRGLVVWIMDVTTSDWCNIFVGLYSFCVYTWHLQKLCTYPACHKQYTTNIELVTVVCTTS